MAVELSETELNQIRNSFRRCSNETLEAIMDYRRTGNKQLAQPIVFGIIQRYTPAESVGKLNPDDTSIRLIEDLGIDSLTMLEIVLSIEEALNIKIENEELMQIRTLGDVQSFMRAKLDQDPAVSGSAKPSTTRSLTRDHIALVLPQQPPFLFLDTATLDGDTIRASYRITGDEYFLEGHFKGDPVFPASIVFEAMGQAACLWVLVNSAEKLGHPLESGHVLFGSMEGAHFYRKARPGHVLEFEIHNTRLREPLAVFSCKASVAGQKVAQVEELVIVFGEATKMDEHNGPHTHPEPVGENLPQF